MIYVCATIQYKCSFSGILVLAFQRTRLQNKAYCDEIWIQSQILKLDHIERNYNIFDFILNNVTNIQEYQLTSETDNLSLGPSVE